MIKLVTELESNQANGFNRGFIVVTERGYGLSTVLGFIKYHLSTSKVELVQQKDFSSKEQAIYSIYNDQGVSIGRAICYTDVNRFDVYYDVSALFSSNISINKID